MMSPLAEVTFVAIAVILVSWVLTYLAHSTILIAGILVWLRSRRAAAVDRVLLWRTAIIAPFITSVMHTAGWLAGPLTGPDPALLFPAAFIDWRLGALTAAFSLAVAGWLCVRAIAATLTVRQMFGRRVDAGDELRNEVLALAAAMACRPPRVTVSPQSGVPAALGTCEICLPANDLDTWTTLERRSIIAHELAHLDRRDPLWLALCTWFVCLVPFQPLARVALRRLRTAAEEAADDGAVAVTGDADALASALVTLAERREGAGLGVAATGSPLVQRVTRLLDDAPAPPSWSRGRRLFVAVALMMGSIGIGPGLVASPRQVLHQVPWLTPGPGTPHPRLLELRQTSRAWRHTLRRAFR